MSSESASPARLIRVETDLGPLAVEEVGAGSPVLLWHSLLADRTIWHRQVEALAPRHRLLLVDGPGHGDSPAPLRPYTLEDCARAGVQILDDLGIANAVWIGLSWGGMTAMRAALLAPGRVRALALLDTSAEMEPLTIRLRNQALLSFYRWWGFRSLLKSPVRRLMLGATTLERDPAAGEEIFEHVRTRDQVGIQQAIETVLIERRSLLADLGRIQVPTLVVVGEEDRTAPPPRALHIARAIPDARLERIPGAGHLTPIETPDVINRLLATFLGDL